MFFFHVYDGILENYSAYVSSDNLCVIMNSNVRTIFNLVIINFLADAVYIEMEKVIIIFINIVQRFDKFGILY